MRVPGVHAMVPTKYELEDRVMLQIFWLMLLTPFGMPTEHLAYEINSQTSAYPALATAAAELGLASRQELRHQENRKLSQGNSLRCNFQSMHKNHITHYCTARKVLDPCFGNSDLHVNEPHFHSNANVSVCVCMSLSAHYY